VRRELAFVARLDRIRQDRSILVEGKFNDRGAEDGYRQAFGGYGVDADVLPPEEAVARLQVNPALAVPIAAALDDWVFVRMRLGNDEATWKRLVAGARRLDRHPLGDQLRATWGQHVTPELQAELRRLAESIDVRAQSPATLQALAHNDLGVALRAQKKLDEAIACFRRAIELDPARADSHTGLGNALADQNKFDEAIPFLRRAIELDPKSATAHSDLGSILCDAKQDYDGAITAFQKAIALEPKYAAAHTNLGNALERQGKPDEAIRSFLKAIELDPKDAKAHNGIGIALTMKNKLDEAIDCYRQAIALDPKYAKTHKNLGWALQEQGKLDQAKDAYQEAIRLQPDYTLAHWNLGHVLMRLGEFRQAREELRRGHESAQWVRQCERLVELDERLPDLLARKTTPASAEEGIELAQLCSRNRLYGAAMHFYEEAFTAAPELADNLAAAHRYNAACAAALAGCGRGKDANKLDDKERARLRQKALDWLRADLAAQRGHLEKDAAKAAPGLCQQLQHWLTDPDFAGVRGSGVLEKLPAPERQPWQQLWDDAAALLERARTAEPPTWDAVYRAMKLTALRAGAGPLKVGDKILINWEWKNTSERDLRLPANDKAPTHSIGTFQHWIERLGDDADIPVFPADVLRAGRLYAAGSWGAFAPPLIPRGRSFPGWRSRDTRGFPPGRYRYHVHFNDADGTTLPSASVEFDLVP
jgi:tetratricopeptide (TPR) repeat protein